MATLTSGFTRGPHSAFWGSPADTAKASEGSALWVPWMCWPRGEGWERGHLCSEAGVGLPGRATPVHLHTSAAEVSCYPLCSPQRTFRLESAPSLQPPYLVARCFQTEGLQHCASAVVKLVLIANSFSPLRFTDQVIFTGVNIYNKPPT